MKTRADIKNQAKNALMNHYWKFVGYSVVLGIATKQIVLTQSRVAYNEYLSNGSYYYNNALSNTISLMILIATIFLLNPLIIGSRSAIRHTFDGTDRGRIQEAFSEMNYKRNVSLMLRTHISIYLWSLLFVIPGIVKAYQYYFVPYLAEDHPELSDRELLELSKRVTKDRKMDLFIFDLSFIGWLICNVLTRGLGGIFYVFPYYYASQTVLYNEFIDAGCDPLRTSYYDDRF